MPLRTRLLLFFLFLSVPSVAVVALGAPYVNHGTLLAVAGVLVVAMAAVGTVIARMVSTPITEWTKIVRQVSSGDLSKKLFVVGDADLDELAFAFNKMTADLKHTLAIFDRRLTARTKLLSEKNQLLKQQTDDLAIRNEFIRRTFGRYLSDEIVAQLLESPEGLEMGGIKRTVTIVMTDLRGFTATSEKLPPEQVVSMLNNYLGHMTEIILKHRGTIDEFIGDAILAIFGAPIKRDDDAERAVACALEMQLAMERVNREHAERGLPAVHMGIGINTGEVVVGNVGSPKCAKYGIVGSHVNLTSRVESYTVGGQVLISETTLRGAGASVIVGEARTVQPKGLKEPIQIFDLLGIGAPYNLKLPREQEVFAALTPPLETSFVVIEEKDVGTERHAATMARLSAHGAELATSCDLHPWTNIKIKLGGPGWHPHEAGLDEEFYAKVTGPREQGGGYVVRFTALPHRVGEFLAAQRSTAAGASAAA
jgi:adenylate cyclase